MSDVTPSLTMVPLTEDALDEATDDPPSDSLLLDRRTVARGVGTAEDMRRGVPVPVNLLTRAMGAKSPYLSLHSKYLQKSF